MRLHPHNFPEQALKKIALAPDYLETARSTFLVPLFHYYDGLVRIPEGSAPDLIKGALQLNIQVPEEAPIGEAVPLVIWVANVPTQEGVTVAVK